MVNYCKDAYKLLGIKTNCGKDCPIVDNCPRLILEDATDEAVSKSIKAMIEAVKAKEMNNNVGGVDERE